MHYRVRQRLVCAENAAKSWMQPSQYVLAWIDALPRRSCVLDFGCGKLRYTIPLCDRVRSVCAVDSAVQVDRVQTIGGVTITARQYAASRLPAVKIYSVDETGWTRNRYDAILCCNVLSAIPLLTVRQRILKKLLAVARDGGLLLATTQYRNSYFTSFASNPRARRHLDGWLVEDPRDANRASFYGMVPVHELSRAVAKAGWHVEEALTKGESAFVVGMKCIS